MRPVAPLSSGGGGGCLGVGFECVVDDVGEAAFEDAEGFAVGVALCFAASDQCLRGRVAVALCERDPVDGGVELAVAAAAEAVAEAAGRVDGQRCGAVVAGVGVAGAEALDAGGVADALCWREGAASGGRQQRRRQGAHAAGGLAFGL